MKKRSVNISGHATSVTLEDAFWDQIKIIASKKNLSINVLISHIDEKRAPETNLSSALRLYILKYLLEKIPKE